MEALIQWKGLPGYEQSWLRVRDLVMQFPDFKLEGKLDRPWRAYIRKRGRGVKKDLIRDDVEY